MALPEDLGEVHPVALSSAHGAHQLVLARAPQVERGRVRADIDLPVPDLGKTRRERERRSTMTRKRGVNVGETKGVAW